MRNFCKDLREHGEKIIAKNKFLLPSKKDEKAIISQAKVQSYM